MFKFITQKGDLTFSSQWDMRALQRLTITKMLHMELRVNSHFIGSGVWSAPHIHKMGMKRTTPQQLLSTCLQVTSLAASQECVISKQVLTNVCICIHHAELLLQPLQHVFGLSRECITLLSTCIHKFICYNVGTLARLLLLNQPDPGLSWVDNVGIQLFPIYSAFWGLALFHSIGLQTVHAQPKCEFWQQLLNFIDMK